jgi:hypothetical protein
MLRYILILVNIGLAHLVREVDVRPSHPGSSPHRRESGFLLFKNKKPAVEASPTAFLSKKKKNSFC